MPRRKKDPPRLIAVEGPIGVGKSTLATLLAERFKARTVLEQIETNPFIESFYEAPRQFGFQTQLFFLLSRHRQQDQLRQQDLFQRTTVTDFIFQKDKIFANLTLNEAELALYDRIYSLLLPRAARPDLLVYLRARPEVLLRRIRTRNRPWERGITLEYLERVVDAYNEALFHYADGPLLVINTSEIDFVEEQSDLEEVISLIRKAPKGTTHVNLQR